LFIQRLVLRFAGLAIGFFATGLVTDTFGVSAKTFVVPVDCAVLLALEESRLMTESPASGGASG
jgi:hypothetical protein